MCYLVKGRSSGGWVLRRAESHWGSPVTSTLGDVGIPSSLPVSRRFRPAPPGSRDKLQWDLWPESQVPLTRPPAADLLRTLRPRRGARHRRHGLQTLRGPLRRDDVHPSGERRRADLGFPSYPPFPSRETTLYRDEPGLERRWNKEERGCVFFFTRV